MTSLLKLFSTETLIEFIIAYLVSTVKNPSSSKALKLRFIVTKLRDAANQYLVSTDGGPFPQ